MYGGLEMIKLGGWRRSRDFMEKGVMGLTGEYIVSVPPASGGFGDWSSHLCPPSPAAPHSRRQGAAVEREVLGWSHQEGGLQHHFGIHNGPSGRNSCLKACQVILECSIFQVQANANGGLYFLSVYVPDER